LVKRHGLRRVHLEGLTREGVRAYRLKAEVARAAEKEDLPTLRRQLEDVRQLLRELEVTGKKDPENYKKTLGMKAEVVALIEKQRVAALELGAPARLLAAGELEEVLPLDDPVALEAAKPIPLGGKVKLDPKKERSRQDAMVRGLVEGGPV